LHTCAVKADGALGTHTFTVTATDNAGNVTTVTHTYRVTLFGLGVGPL